MMRIAVTKYPTIAPLIIPMLASRFLRVKSLTKIEANMTKMAVIVSYRLNIE